MKRKKFSAPMILGITTGSGDVIGGGSGQSSNDGEGDQGGDLVLWTYDEWVEIYADHGENDLNKNGVPCEEEDYELWVMNHFQ